MYSDSDISRVRDSVDIVDLISGYVSLRKRGKSWLGLCPFHSEKTPSFNVNADKQIFHCFGCGVGGDAFKFLELQKGLNFPEAVRELAERAGIALPESRPGRGSKQAQDERRLLLAAVAEAADHFRRELNGPSGSAARAYLAKRGVSDAIIEEFGIGFARQEWEGLHRHLKQKGIAPQMQEKAGLVVGRSEAEGHYDRFRGRIIFPIRDINGSVIAFGGRVMDDTLPKYLNSPETPLYNKSSILYGMDRAKEAARKSDHFIIVEGYLDAIACHQHGVRNAVATLGTALTDGHLRLMRRFTKKLKLIFDPDPAGVKAALRSFDLLAESGMQVKVVSLPGGDDPDTMLAKSGREAFAASLAAAVPLMDFVLQQVVQEGAKYSIDEKKEMERDVLTYISKLSTSIEREHYIRKAATSLNVSESALLDDLNKMVRSPGPAKESSLERPADASRRSAQRSRSEEMLIHLMVHDDLIAKRVVNELVADDFSDELFRKAFSYIASNISKGNISGDRSRFLEDDKELASLISRLSVLGLAHEYGEPDANAQSNADQIANDCVSVIRRQDPEKRMKEVEALIAKADERGDLEEVSRLQKLLMELRQQLKSTHGHKVPGYK